MPGSFVFKPIEAKLTHNTSLLTTMDPYCAFVVGDKRISSQVCKHGGTNPHWNDTLSVSPSNESKVLVEVMDKVRITGDDLIGSVELDLKEIESQGKVSKWYPVTYQDEPAGEILLESTFRGEGSTEASVEGSVVEEELPKNIIIAKDEVKEKSLSEAGQNITNKTQVNLSKETKVTKETKEVTASHASATAEEHHRTYVEQRQKVEPHTFTKDVEVVETVPVKKLIEVMEPRKVMKKVQYTEAVPVKKTVETFEPRVVTKEIEVMEPRVVTKTIEVVENVAVMKQVQFVENVPITKEIETKELQTFTKFVEVIEQVPVIKEVTVTEPVHVKKSVEMVEPIITTQTITKEIIPEVVIGEEVTTTIGPATLKEIEVIEKETEIKKNEAEIKEKALIESENFVHETEKKEIINLAEKKTTGAISTKQKKKKKGHHHN